MYRIIYFLIVSFFISNTSFSQDNQISYEFIEGEKYKVGFMGMKILGKLNNNYFVLRSSRKKSILEKYGNEMNKIQEEEIHLLESQKKSSLEKIILYDDQIHLFTSFLNQKQKKNYLFHQVIDTESLKITNEPRLVAEIDYGGSSKINSGNFDFKFSPDSTKLLVYYNLPFKPGTAEKFGFSVLDNNFSLIWNKNITLPYIDKLFKIHDYNLDKNGNVYLVGKHLENMKDEYSIKDNVANYDYKFFCYRKDTEDFEYHAELSGKFVPEVKLSISKENRVVCQGFYSEHDANSMEGIFHLEANPESLDKTIDKYIHFGSEFIKSNYKEKYSDKIDKMAEKGRNIGLNRNVLNRLIVEENNTYLVSERKYFKRKTSSSGTTTTTYYANDISVIKTSDAGDLEFFKIPKKQWSSTEYILSYGLFKKGENLYFIHNANAKNLEDDNDNLIPFTRTSPCYLALTLLNPTGSTVEESLGIREKGNTMPVPANSHQVSKNEMIILHYWGGYAGISKLIIN